MSHYNGGLMNAFDMLRKEHRIIEQVLRCVDSICSKWYLKSTVDTSLARSALVFLLEFADGCHHHKEEALLFPQLEKHKSSKSTQLSRLLDEHRICRQLLGRMCRAIDRYDAGEHDAGDEFAALVSHYVPLLKRHIALEDQDLFVIASEKLSTTEMEGLQTQFVQLDHTSRFADEKYLKLAYHLTAQLGLPTPDFTDINTSACHCLNFLKDMDRSAGH